MYDLALANDCYRWSCSTFSMWTFLALVFQRSFLYERYGRESVMLACCGALQTVVSYLGDVYYLKGGPWGTAFWPDIGLATTLVGWATRLHWRERSFQAAMFVSGSLPLASHTSSTPI